MADGKGVTVLFLGSGFSKAVGGVPIQDEFLAEVLSEGRDSWINDCGMDIGGEKLSEWMLNVNNVEICMSHLHNLAYSELATPSSKRSAKKAIINLRAATREFLTKNRQGEVSKSEFKKKIIGAKNGKDLIILTVNYDLLIEAILGNNNYEYRDLLIRSAQSSRNPDGNKIPLYKLHGSINWMEERTPGEKSNSGKRELTGTEPLYVDDPKWWRNRKDKSIDCSGYRVWKKSKNGEPFTPIMIPFFYQKEEWLGQRWGCLFQRHWASAAKCLEKERIEKMIFIGYSLPPADTYIMSWLLISLGKMENRPVVEVVHRNPCGEPIEKALAPYLKEKHIWRCGLQQYMDEKCR